MLISNDASEVNVFCLPVFAVFQVAFVTHRLYGDKLIFSKCEKRIANSKFIVDINVYVMRMIAYRI